MKQGIRLGKYIILFMFFFFSCTKEYHKRETVGPWNEYILCAMETAVGQYIVTDSVRTLTCSVYDTASVSILKDAYMTELCEGPEGKFGLVLKKYIYEYNEGILSRTGSIYGSNIQMTYASKDTIWLTANSSVYQIAKGLLIKETNTILEQQSHDDIKFGATGCIFIIDAGRFLMKQNNTWNEFKKKANGYPFQDATCIATDKNGNAWIFSQSEGGLAYFDLSNSTFTHFTSTSTSFPPTTTHGDLIVDTLGRLMIASDLGLLVFDGATWTTYPVPENLCHQINSVTISRRGVITGAFKCGLATFDYNTGTFSKVGPQ